LGWLLEDSFSSIGLLVYYHLLTLGFYIPGEEQFPDLGATTTNGLYWGTTIAAFNRAPLKKRRPE